MSTKKTAKKVARKAVAKRPRPPKGEGGRPTTPPGEALVSYGLRLAPDKKQKLFALKTFHGLSVRECIEGWIEREYQEMIGAKKIARAR